MRGPALRRTQCTLASAPSNVCQRPRGGGHRHQSLLLQVEDALARELCVIDSHGAALNARVTQLDAQLLKLAGAAATVTANLEDKRAGEEVRGARLPVPCLKRAFVLTGNPHPTKTPWLLDSC